MPASVQQVIALRRQGLKIDEIGARLGIHPSSAYRAIQYAARTDPTLLVRINRPRCTEGCGRPQAPGAVDGLCWTCRRRADRPPREWNTAAIVGANGRRSARAASATVAQARVRLAAPDLSEVHREALQARVDHPTASLAEIGRALGMSKDAYAARLRRALTPRGPDRLSAQPQRGQTVGNASRLTRRAEGRRGGSQ